jgi:hypothetical protein
VRLSRSVPNSCPPNLLQLQKSCSNSFFFSSSSSLVRLKEEEQEEAAAAEEEEDRHRPNPIVAHHGL